MHSPQQNRYSPFELYRRRPGDATSHRPIAYPSAHGIFDCSPVGRSDVFARRTCVNNNIDQSATRPLGRGGGRAEPDDIRANICNKLVLLVAICKVLQRFQEAWRRFLVWSLMLSQRGAKPRFPIFCYGHGWIFSGQWSTVGCAVLKRPCA